jgi:hypothetical protein
LHLKRNLNIMLSIQLPLEKLTYPSSSFDEREQYYLQFLPSTKTEYYKSIFKAHHVSATSKLENTIKFIDISFGESSKEIVNKLGKPRFKIDYEVGNKSIKVLFFKQDFFGIDAVVQFHCLNENFFYGSITIPSLEKEVIETLNDILSLKYGLHVDSKNLNPNEFIVCDRQENKIIFQNFFYPSLIYLDGKILNYGLDEILPAEKTKEEFIKNSAWLTKL